MFEKSGRTNHSLKMQQLPCASKKCRAEVDSVWSVCIFMYRRIFEILPQMGELTLLVSSLSYFLSCPAAPILCPSLVGSSKLGTVFPLSLLSHRALCTEQILSKWLLIKQKVLEKQVIGLEFEFNYFIIPGEFLYKLQQISESVWISTLFPIK